MPRPPAGKPSQTQLAKELGLSQSLVSMVLNGRRTGISPETYDRIWAHAVKRGYHPKGMRLSASPAAGRPRSVGFILRAPLRLDTLGNYFGRVQHGLHKMLAEARLTTVFLGSEDALTKEQLAGFFPAGHPYQGVVLLGEVAPAFVERLRQHERRLVMVSGRHPGFCHSVIGNEPQALQQLVQHLVSLGHRRIGWIGGNQGMGRHEMRFQAYAAAMANAGLEVEERTTLTLREADRDEGAEAAHQMLARSKARPARPLPTAFICYNGLMAEGAVRGFERAGFNVPKHLSIAAADAPRTALNRGLAITSAGAPPEKLGESAGRLVLGSTGATD
ncbi:MAG: LacI family DNA-binding transcriptional regulator, partial [Opitutus sp.]